MHKPRFCNNKICPKGRPRKSRRDFLVLVEVIPKFARTFSCGYLSSLDNFYCKFWDKGILKTIGSILLPCLLMLDAAWAGSMEIQLADRNHLSAPIQINQQNLVENFTALYMKEGSKFVPSINYAQNLQPIIQERSIEGKIWEFVKKILFLTRLNHKLVILITTLFLFILPIEANFFKLNFWKLIYAEEMENRETQNLIKIMGVEKNFSLESNVQTSDKIGDKSSEQRLTQIVTIILKITVPIYIIIKYLILYFSEFYRVLRGLRNADLEKRKKALYALNQIVMSEKSVKKRKKIVQKIIKKIDRSKDRDFLKNIELGEELSSAVLKFLIKKGDVEGMISTYTLSRSISFGQIESELLKLNATDQQMMKFYIKSWCLNLKWGFSLMARLQSRKEESPLKRAMRYGQGTLAAQVVRFLLSDDEELAEYAAVVYSEIMQDVKGDERLVADKKAFVILYKKFYDIRKKYNFPHNFLPKMDDYRRRLIIIIQNTLLPETLSEYRKIINKGLDGQIDNALILAECFQKPGDRDAACQLIANLKDRLEKKKCSSVEEFEIIFWIAKRNEGDLNGFKRDILFLTEQIEKRSNLKKEWILKYYIKIEDFLKNHPWNIEKERNEVRELVLKWGSVLCKKKYWSRYY